MQHPRVIKQKIYAANLRPIADGRRHHHTDFTDMLTGERAHECHHSRILDA